MEQLEKNTKVKLFSPVTGKQRLFACLILMGIVGFFAFLWLAGAGKIEPTLFFGLCGFKQRTGLPCMGCGMTTSAIAFARGQIARSFYIQPAAALFCCVFIIGAFFAFLAAVFGVYFSFLKRFFAEIKIRYLILAVIFIFSAGWAVTLARALAEKSN